MAQKITPRFIEEIIVTEKRIAPGSSRGGPLEFFFRSGGRDVSEPGYRRFAEFQRAMVATEAERSVIAGQTRAEYNLGKARAAKLAKLFDPIDEIVVIGKRAPIGLVRAFAGPAIFAADVGARLIDEISRQRLDEVGRVATLTAPPKPDTPVKTIKAETIDEIIVKGKRPFRRPAVLVPGRIDIPRDSLGDPRVPLGVGRLPAISIGKVPAPTKPAKKIAPRSPVLAFRDPGVAPVSVPRTRAVTIPRSRLLNIGGSPNPLINPGLTGSNAGGVPLPMTAPVRVRANICPPCPSSKRKRKQNRTKCYKKLVEERRTKDKVFKWTRIDCDTGREIRGK